MRKELAERRRKMLKLRFSGVEDWAEQISEDYDISKSGVHEDWRRMGSWIEDLDGAILENAVRACKENLYEQKRARQIAWSMLNQCDNENARVGYLNMINKSAKDHTRLLVELGRLEKELTPGNGNIPQDEKIIVNIQDMDEPDESEEMSLGEIRDTAQEAKEDLK